MKIMKLISASILWWRGFAEGVERMGEEEEENKHNEGILMGILEIGDH